MFVDNGDHVILPDMLWGNYNLTFGTCNGGIVKKHPTFTVAGGYDVDAFKAELKNTADEKGKAVVLLNFPNNPSGYTPTVAEGDAIVAAILEVADSGCNIVAVTDDAYFGLFYEDTLKESLFGKLANLIRASWRSSSTAPPRRSSSGASVPASSPSPLRQRAAENAPVMAALEKKTMGIIRAKISNCPHPSPDVRHRGAAVSRLPRRRRKKSSRS